jgi:tagatose 6-phosphate kinase
MPENDKKKFSENLKRAGIQATFLPVEGSVRLCTTLIENKNHQVSHIVTDGQRLSPRIQDEFVALCEKHMKPHDLWALPGSLPSGFEHDVYAKIIRLCKKRKIPTLLDTRGKALTSGIRAKPVIIKPNLSELEAYFSEPIKGVAHIALKAKRLLDTGIEQIFISLGVDGMMAVKDNECLLCIPPEVTAIDTVGCGDAVVAGILVGQSRNFSFSEQCRLAVACGTSKATTAGPVLRSKENVWQLMEEVRIESI